MAIKRKSGLPHQMTHLKQLSRTKEKRKRNNILKKGGTDLTKCLCECALNVIKGNVPLSSKQFDKLKPFKNPITKLGNKRIPLYRKRKIIQQSGGSLLTVLLTPILGALASKFLK